MNNNSYITIEGYSFKEVKQSLEDWIKLYAGKIETIFVLEILEKNKNSCCVNVNGEIDNNTFNFLVNYLVYPENEKPNAKVRGYTTTRNKRIFPSQELDKRVVIFIPKEDKEYDNVYASTGDGKTFIVDFGGKTKEIDFLITFEELDLSEYVTTKFSIKPINEKSQQEVEENQIDITKQFIYFFIPSFVITISLLEKTKYSYYSLAILGIILSFWIAFSHKLVLRKKSNYIILLISSLLIGGTAILYNELFSKKIDSFLAIAFFYPFWMLICYKIFRPIFKLAFKKEPKIDRYSWEFKTSFYTFLILGVPFLISLFLIFNYLDYESFKRK